jgi:hypothetical protein
MRFRKLRIAWSVLWGLLAMLLIALWVRTYHETDTINAPLAGRHSVQIISCYGKVAFILTPYVVAWHHETQPLGQYIWRKEQFRAFHYYDSVPRTGNRHEWAFSYSLLTSLVAVLAATPWCTGALRFSLRTLLIATTLVAVLLDLIVYATR